VTKASIEKRKRGDHDYVFGLLAMNRLCDDRKEDTDIIYFIT
jgi:hypothetical protein